MLLISNYFWLTSHNRVHLINPDYRGIDSLYSLYEICMVSLQYVGILFLDVKTSCTLHELVIKRHLELTN